VLVSIHASLSRRTRGLHRKFQLEPKANEKYASDERRLV
jgi:hypothetical protein